MKNTLNGIFNGKVGIVGIGNPIRSDDGFGPALIERVKDKVDAVCIDAGSAPENYLGKIIKENPDTIIVADAVHLDDEPGVWCILKKEDILKTGFTTHDLSPVMFIEYLEKEINAEIYMLAVQPESLAFGTEMTESVNRALNEITREIIRVLGNL